MNCLPAPSPPQSPPHPRPRLNAPLCLGSPAGSCAGPNASASALLALRLAPRPLVTTYHRRSPPFDTQVASWPSVTSVTSRWHRGHSLQPLHPGGISVIELVLRTPAAEAAISAIAAHVPQMLLGAGTVLSTAQAERVVALGAQFIVAPGLNPKVVRWCVGRQVCQRLRMPEGWEDRVRVTACDCICQHATACDSV